MPEPLVKSRFFANQGRLKSPLDFVIKMTFLTSKRPLTIAYFSNIEILKSPLLYTNVLYEL